MPSPDQRLNGDPAVLLRHACEYCGHLWAEHGRNGCGVRARGGGCYCPFTCPDDRKRRVQAQARSVR